MNRIDESKPFKPVQIAVLTVSDTRTLETDKSGDTLAERIARDGHVLADRAIVTDDVALIRAQVQKWIDDPGIEAVITTGGTGVTGRDVTPEALEGLFEKRIEGFGEVFRWISFQKIGTSTMQSRAIAGVANAT
jgi:molybdenum cofactor biosynthesis protein B